MYFFSKINIKIKIKRMPHGTRYRVGLHISCCQADWFPPIFQSFKNKNKWITLNRTVKTKTKKKKKHSGDHDIYHFRSYPFKHAYIKNTTGISTYSSLNIGRGGRGKQQSPSLENKFSVISQSHRMSAPPLQQLSVNTQTSLTRDRHRHPFFFFLSLG